MWRPETWADLQSLLGNAEESSSLDFKEELGGNGEMAKDIAAMTVNGGSIIYGVVEDREARVAEKLRPLPLRGVEERIQQVTGSLISPTPGIEVISIPSPDRAGEGVVAVIVPPSPAAPHQTNGRYPTRRGTTTGYLDEPEVERFYQRRLEAWSGTAQEASLRFTQPPQRGREPYPLDADIGILEVVVSCPTGRHPRSPWLRDLFDEVIDATEHRLATLMSVQTHFLNGLKDDWHPLDTIGWYGGRGGFQNDTLGREPRSAAVFTYPCDWSFWISLPLAVRGRDGGRLYACAHEWSVAAETIAALAFAGEFMTAIPAAGILGCHLTLGGFDNALPWWRTRASANDFGDEVAPVPPRFTGATYTSAVGLRQAPQETARTLLDPWFATFRRGGDLIDGLLPAADQAG